MDRSPDSEKESTRHAPFTTGIPDLDKLLAGIEPGDVIVYLCDDSDDYFDLVRTFARSNAAYREVAEITLTAARPLDLEDVHQRIHLPVEGDMENIAAGVDELLSHYTETACMAFPVCTDVLKVVSEQQLVEVFYRAASRIGGQSQLGMFGLFQPHLSVEAIARIRDISSVVIGVEHGLQRIRVRPIKVARRYTPMMFRPHFLEKGRLIPCEDYDILSYSQALEAKTRELTHGMEPLSEEERRQWTERIISIGQFASTIAHQISNSLSSVKMTVETLAERPDLGPRDQRRLEIAIREVRHIEEILSSMRTFAKPQIMQRGRSDLTRLVSETIGGYGRQPPITLKLHHKLPQMNLDASKIKIALSHVLDNAVEALRQNIDDPRITIELKQVEGGVELSVADNGPGIKDHLMERIYEPFFTTRASGSGLGLAIAKRFLEMHDGSINITPAEPSGTIITMFLPLEEPDDRNRQAGAE